MSVGSTRLKTPNLRHHPEQARLICPVPNVRENALRASGPSGSRAVSRKPEEPLPVQRKSSVLNRRGIISPTSTVTSLFNRSSHPVLFTPVFARISPDYWVHRVREIFQEPSLSPHRSVVKLTKFSRRTEKFGTATVALELPLAVPLRPCKTSAPRLQPHQFHTLRSHLLHRCLPPYPRHSLRRYQLSAMLVYRPSSSLRKRPSRHKLSLSNDFASKRAIVSWR